MSTTNTTNSNTFKNNLKHYLDQADLGQAIFITRGGKIYKLVAFKGDTDE